MSSIFGGRIARPGLIQRRQAQGWSLLTSAWREIAPTGQHNAIPKPGTAAAFTLAIASTSANDASAGSGARKVRTTYLKANGTENVTETTLSGTSAVNVSAATDCLAVLYGHVSEAGAVTGQDGEISYGAAGSFTAGAPSTYYGKIQKDLWTSSIAPTNRTRSCVVKVPASVEAAVLGLQIACEEDAIISLDVHPHAAAAAPFEPSRGLWSGLVKAPGRDVALAVPFDLDNDSVGFAPELHSIDALSWIVVSGIRDTVDGYCSVVMDYELRPIA